MAADNCALNADSTLMNTSDIDWFDSETDERPIKKAMDSAPALSASVKALPTLRVAGSHQRQVTWKARGDNPLAPTNNSTAIRQLFQPKAKAPLNLGAPKRGHNARHTSSGSANETTMDVDTEQPVKRLKASYSSRLRMSGYASSDDDNADAASRINAQLRLKRTTTGGGDGAIPDNVASPALSTSTLPEFVSDPVPTGAKPSRYPAPASSKMATASAKLKKKKKTVKMPDLVEVYGSDDEGDERDSGDEQEGDELDAYERVREEVLEERQNRPRRS
ncbi:hypothetical protein OBBRIDRAFT_834186 [Obba rivulosa]|uniref:Uncharacterized protein n=1 Tax=Obba rivulosa TaxID=1052685 RepID=A0A8E2AYD8_9APHY|nr:hypothetical protein OBBRIDRAFT_834186 [Obba rivulosa]